MKPFTLILFTGLLFVCSCTGEMTNESDTSPNSELFPNERIRCMDGARHFPRAESCIQTMKSSASEAYLEAFENHFVS